MFRPRFNLRALFVLTATIAVGCWIGKSPVDLSGKPLQINPSDRIARIAGGVLVAVLLQAYAMLLGTGGKGRRR
jgi:hypothetical protein